MNVNRNELSQCLEMLFQAENRIAEIIKKSGLRFSTNKLTADLGEFYVHQIFTERAMFESIETHAISNADFDLKGTIAPGSTLAEIFRIDEIRIEVKTRRNQKGVKYLSGVKPEKFDLLCVVDIAKNYSLNKIHLVKSEIAYEYLDRKRQRLIFKDSMAFLSLDGFISY